MARRPTVYDVAQRAGVSIATVSFAFGQPQRVKKETLDAVLAAADALGYLPSASARGLARGRTGAIGLYSFDYLLAELERPADPVEDGCRIFPLYVDEVRNGVELECRRLGYAIMVGAGRTTPPTPPVIDIAGRVDGLIAFAGTLTADVIATVTRRIPVVALGTDVSGTPARTVAVDNAGGMRELTEHLIAAHGCRHFVYQGNVAIVEFAARYAGFAAALTAAGIEPPPPHTPLHPGQDAGPQQAVRAALERGQLPDAFVCSTDQEALDVLDALAAAGVDVPGQVLVTGFDGIAAGRLSTPTLTTVRQPMEAIGRAAVRIVARLLDGEPEPEPEPPLPVRLVVRDSCGCGPVGTRHTG